MRLRIRRRATTTWEGDVPNGNGRISVGSGAIDVPFSLASRVGDEPQTNPEELIGAAHSACFAMSLANLLSEEGYLAVKVSATATVFLEELESGYAISRIEMFAEGSADELAEDEFIRLAERAKETCPVSKVLKGVDIELTARLQAVIDDDSVLG